jgi:hypothetical protein
MSPNRSYSAPKPLQETIDFGMDRRITNYKAVIHHRQEWVILTRSR